jgi:hypothetical protein
MILILISFKNVDFFHSFNKSRHFWCFVDKINLDYTFSKLKIFNVKSFFHNKKKCRNNSHKNKWIFWKRSLWSNENSSHITLNNLKYISFFILVLITLNDFKIYDVLHITIRHCENENFVKHNLITLFQTTLIWKIIFNFRKKSVEMHDHHLSFNRFVKNDENLLNLCIQC